MAEEKKRIPLWSVFAAVILAVAFGYLVFHYVKGIQPSESQVVLPAIGGPFSLVDHHGNTVTDEDFGNDFKLVYFGYTYSPDESATTLTTISDALGLLGPDGERIAPVFITLDPERDSPAQLKMYVEYFHPRLIALTGSLDAVKETAGKFQVHFAKVNNPGGDAEDYVIDHTAIVYLMGPEGDFRAHFTDGASAETMAERIREHL